MSSLLARRTGVTSLSPRERQVAELIAQGLSYKEVAARLGLSAGTVKVRLSRDIFPKLGVGCQAELVRKWITEVEMAGRGDCESCILRRAHLPVPPEDLISID